MKKAIVLIAVLGIAIWGVTASQKSMAADVSMVHTFSDSADVSDTTQILKQIENLKSLQAELAAGKPTLAFFYYSVACSCAAAKCNIAATAIDSIPELNGKNENLNFSKIDAYLVPEAESIFNIIVIPAVVYFDKDGKEVNRIEWGTNKDAIKMLIEHPEIKQVPLD